MYLFFLQKQQTSLNLLSKRNLKAVLATQFSKSLLPMGEVSTTTSSTSHTKVLLA